MLLAQWTSLVTGKAIMVSTANGTQWKGQLSAPLGVCGLYIKTWWGENG